VGISYFFSLLLASFYFLSNLLASSVEYLWIIALIKERVIIKWNNQEVDRSDSGSFKALGPIHTFFFWKINCGKS
jgi:hypothetical protein